MKKLLLSLLLFSVLVISPPVFAEDGSLPVFAVDADRFYPDAFVDSLTLDFLDVFGAPPKRAAFRRGSVGNVDFILAAKRYMQDAEQFKGKVDVPEGYTAQQVASANNVFIRWAMGEVRFYEGKYGVWAMFPRNRFGLRYETSVIGVFYWTHGLIANFQIMALRNGFLPTQHGWAQRFFPTGKAE